MPNENEIRSDNHRPTLLVEFGGFTKRLQADENGLLKIKNNISPEYITEIVRGNVPGEVAGSIIGYNPALDADTEEIIWDQGGMYTYLTADTTLYASSSSVSDTAVTLVITGLDDTYTEITRTVTLNGQSQVALSGDMFRVFTAIVTGATEPLGDIYIAETDTLTLGVPNTVSKIKAKIDQGKNKSFNGLYTVPAGKSVEFRKITYTGGKGIDISFNSRIRQLGGVFINFIIFSLYQQVYQADLLGGPRISEKSDIEISGIASNASSSGGFSLQYILKDN